jgi:hypothetical protein
MIYYAFSLVRGSSYKSESQIDHDSSESRSNVAASVSRK